MAAVRLIQVNRQVDAIKQNVPRNDVFGEAWHGYQLDIFLPHLLPVPPPPPVGGTPLTVAVQVLKYILVSINFCELRGLLSLTPFCMLG
jgi:hypothetical protein